MKRKLIFLIPVLVIILTSAFYIRQTLTYHGLIYPGTRINGYDVSGLTPHQATAYLKKTLPDPRYLYISTNDFHSRLNLVKYGAVPDFAYAVKKAYRVGRGNRRLKNLSIVFLNRFRLTAIRVDYRLDTVKLKEELKIISVQINQPAVNARRVVSGNKISLIPDQTGYKLKIDSAAKKIAAALAENRRSIELPVVKSPPKVRLSFLKKQNIHLLIGEFQTTLNPDQKARNTNIKIASQKIDDTILPPNAVFSFNKIVGRRDKANGFQSATEIRNGNLAKGIGGGICQVATTLYNSFMLAGLPTIERHIHSNYIAAYPTGRDASIAEGRYDLKFKNDTSGSILIKATIDSDRLIVRIYGPRTGRINSFSEPRLGEKVPYKIKNEIDNTLPMGITLIIQTGVAGRRVVLDRYVRSADGKLLFKENIVSRYQPRAEIIKSGPSQ